MYVNVYFKLTCIVLQLNILICTLSNYILLQLKDTIVFKNVTHIPGRHSDTNMLKYSCVLLFSLFLICGKRTLINFIFEMQVCYVMYVLFVISSVSLININGL